MLKSVAVVFTGILLMATPVWSAPAAATSQVVCVSTATGAIATRRQCKRGETKFSRGAYTAPDTALSARIDSVTTAITSLESTGTSQSSAIAELQGSATSQASVIADLESAADGQSSSIASLSTSVNSLSTTQTSHTASLAAHGTAITALESTNATQTSNITSLTTASSSHSATLNTLQPSNLFLVSATGGKYTTIASAITAAQAAGVTATNPAVISVAPGTYTISSTVTLIPGITIVGSGIDRTIIEGDFPGYFFQMANNSALESLTIQQSGSEFGRLVAAVSVTGVAVRRVKFNLSDAAISMSVLSQASSVELEDVEIRHITSNTDIGLVGIYAYSNSQLTIRRLNATAVGGGYVTQFLLLSSNSSFSMYDSYINLSDPSVSVTAVQMSSSGTGLIKNSRIMAHAVSVGGAYAVYTSSSGALTVLDSSIECSGTTGSGGCMYGVGGSETQLLNSRVTTENGRTTIRAVGTAYKVAHSHLAGGAPVGASGGSVTCAGVSDGDYVFYQSSCS